VITFTLCMNAQKIGNDGDETVQEQCCRQQHWRTTIPEGKVWSATSIRIRIRFYNSELGSTDRMQTSGIVDLIDDSDYNI
jgi:hypothetical protein